MDRVGHFFVQVFKVQSINLDDGNTRLRCVAKNRAFCISDCFKNWFFLCESCIGNNAGGEKAKRNALPKAILHKQDLKGYR